MQPSPCKEFIEVFIVHSEIAEKDGGGLCCFPICLIKNDWNLADQCNTWFHILGTLIALRPLDPDVDALQAAFHNKRTSHRI